MNRVERKYGKKQKTIYCVVPPNLTKQEIKIEINFDLNNFEQPKYGEFSLNGFLNRYLAGSRSLKEARTISRKRLALVSSHIGYIDPLAIDLVLQIERYQKARELIANTSHITLNKILDINRLVEVQNNKSGTIRTIQNWIGGKSPFNTTYVCPPPELIDGLLVDWLAFVNDKSISQEVIAIIGHNQLLSIHPFMDGNGRTGRIFLQSLLEKKYGEIIHPSLYRLHKENDAYIAAIHSTLTVESFSQPLHEYWQESLSWADSTKRKMYKILARGKSMFNNQLALRVLSENARLLIDYLWIQPIICDAGLLKRFGWDFFTSQHVIQELISTNILEVRRLREPEGAVIYDCPLIFDIWRQLDDAIFEIGSIAE